MKRHNLLNLLTALISLISVNAYAHDIAVQNDDKIIYYNFINNNSELEVTFSGTSYSYEDNEYSGNIVIPESVIYQGTAYSVTSIGEHALSFCSRLTSVSIPNSVTSIGNGAFQNCINIKTVSIPNSVISIGDKAFEACISLTTVSISNSATSIGAYAFNGCNKLKTVNIPSGVRDINERTFYGCSSLASIELPNTITSIEAYAFGGCSSLASIELPNTITSIGKAAFSSCSSLTEITIPGSLLMETEDYFSQFAFSGCSGLRKITINKGAAVWGNALFDSSQRVVETVVVYNETPIDVYDSFFWIANHATLYVPSGCSAAYKEASGWKKFTKIVEMDPDVDYSDIGKTFTVDGINYKVSSINPLEVQVGWYQESSLGGAIGANYEGPLTIPSSVTGPNGKVYACTSICDEAFLNHSGLTSITIPNGVTTIAQGVFHGCTSLASITIPNSITSIGAEAFRNCSGLISITIPNSVTSIGDYAFYDCGDLTSVLVESQTPLNIYEGVFSNRANATLYVPKDSKAAYEGADYWKEFKEIIEMENSPVAEYTDEQGVKYSLNDDKSTYSVSGYTDACTGDIIIPSFVKGCSVISIANSAFMNCYALSTITIPNSVASIGQSAFSDCTGLALVNIEVETPIAITADVFTNADRVNAALHVPAGCKVAYADAPIWNEFGTILEGNEGTIINANTTEGWNVAFTTLDDTKKTCQVGYLDGSFNKPAVDRDAVDGSLTIPESVEGYTVVKIGKYAFDNANEMTSVTIPATVTSIDENAFFNCNELTSFELPASVVSLGHKALSSLRSVEFLKVAEGNTVYDSRGDCNAIIETATNKILFGSKITTIPASVTEIGESAFYNLESFTFTIPATVTKIDDNAFYFCSNWTLQVENTTPLQISENVFGDMSNSTTLRVPAGSKAAYASATGWKNFSTIMEGNEGSTFTAKTTEGIDMVFTILDESAKTCQVGYIDGSQDKMAVDRTAVNGAVTIPQTVEGYTVVKIGKFAFYDIDAIKSVSIPETVTSIDDYAFFSCDGLSSFELSASVTNIGKCAFAVPSLKVAEGNPKYDSRDNCNAIIEKATNILVVGCRTTRIPASVSEIGSYAFTGLYDCTILLPSTITKIGDHAFEGNRLTLQVENMNPLVINENVFQGLNNSTLRVPAGCKAVYAEATGWSKFNNILEGNEGSSFTVKTTEGYEMVFTVLDETAKTCQVGYLDGSWDKVAVDKETVEGPVTIPEKANNYTVVKIGKWALTNINGMTSVTIPNTVTYIDEFAFRYCNGLTSFDLPASVTYVGQYALSALSNVTSIKVAEGNPNYDSRDNCNAIIETATNKLLFGYKISTIPASVKEIGENAFYNLNNCTLTIPSTITKICDYAFGFSYYLTLQVENTVPLVISENVFSDLRYSTLRVPTGSKSAYAEATGWSKFETIMEGNEGTTFTAQTTEGWDMVFSILDDDAKTCQVGYLDGSSMKIAVDKEAVNGAVTIPQTVEGYTVVKIGEYAFQGVNGMTSVTIPETVTAIGDFAFAECNGLTSFELPASVSAIGIWALSGLENAKSITVAEGNTTYDSRDNCNAIIEKATNKLLFGYKTTIIPASVTEIGSIAFDGFSDFTLTIPSTITAIDDGAFSCNYLTLQVEHTTPLVIEDAFRNLHNSTLRVPAGCKAAYVAATGWNNFDYIFEGNEGATFTAKTTEGWDMVFTVLNETAKTCQVGYIYGSYDKIAIDRNVVNGAVTIPQTIEGYTVVKIGKFAFFNNDGITSVTIPNSVTSIDEYAFSSCYLLTSLEIPASVTNIGDRAFSDLNYYKTSIKVAEGNPNYDSRDNCNAIIETATNKLLFGCKNTKIPASVTEIGDRAFSGILLGNSTILIPSTITKIDDYAFAWCNDLVMEVERTTPLQINENVFEGLSNSTLLVPTGSKEAYAAATGWSKFDNIIFDYKVSKNVETAGTLSQMISDAEKFTIRELTITGSLNGEDFRFIREMAGSDYNGVPTDGILTTLDLSGATIVAGGSYVEIQDKKVYLNKEKTIYTSSGGVVDGEKVSEANKIGAYLFAGCQKLQTITLPNNITAIDDFGFWATGLTAITMPNTVTSIGSDAFFTCNYLASVAIPSSVTSISSAFHGCSDLASITVDSNNPVYDSRNGCNAIIETSSNTLLVGCENTTIPNGIIIIGSAALSYKNLTSITIPGSVTTIGNNAFGGNNLTSITIPSSVTSIANYAFADNKLQTVTIENPTPVAIYDDTFSNRSNIDLIVPEGRSAIYKSANYWKDFKSIKDTKGNSEDPITEATINVTTAGTLSQFISDAEKFTITDLTITGPLNGTDFRLLREMAGCDYLGRPTEGKLQKLDLSGATIVAGGDKYFDRDGLYHENGERQYGFGQHSVTTRDNVIGECLFAGCSKLEEIKIPANIIEIGEFAFMCTNISSFDIPETIEKVALSFFWGTKISTLHIPQNVTTLTASYFMGNQATLSSITVDANNAKFDSRNNCNAIVEKESNTLLLGCKNTTIPDGITSIGLCAFVRCYNLTSITIPASVTSLQEGAFFDTGLNSISLPSTLKRIEFNALAYNNIASITIPASVEFIGQSALRACRDLTQITVEAENTVYDSRNNCNAIIETATNTLIQGCNTATIPATVTAIGNQAFQECHDLANITIPSSVTSIADCAFYECENLTSVSVGVNTPLAISENTFSNRANATLYVPTGCVDAYKEAEYWKEFKEIIGTEVQTDNIVFSGSNLWAGYVASEDLAIPAGLEAYVITSLGTTTATASSLNYIPQGVPVLLKRDNASINNYEVSTGSGTAPTVNLLRAYEYDKSVSNREGFILYNDEFVLVNEGTLPAGRVFLPANGSGRGLTRSIVFDRDDIIDSDDSQNNDGSNQWYDIQGRKLEQKPTKKGIYILDGRKVVIK